ncbi:MAG: GntR family transcriptional regulator [Chloroflexi bacterium]|nr:GntR family transcriptional regulator [Chloroflexota bacterium]
MPTDSPFETFLYRRIAEEIRNNIMDGKFKAGERLPSIRSMSQKWNCTPGTIQRAYNELARQELVISQVGRGTHVVNPLDIEKLQTSAPLRQAKMVNRTEMFFLEALLAGYSLEEIQHTTALAIEHLQTIQKRRLAS